MSGVLTFPEDKQELNAGFSGFQCALFKYNIQIQNIIGQLEDESGFLNFILCIYESSLSSSIFMFFLTNNGFVQILRFYKLFATRADLHRTVYTHAKEKAIEFVVVDALVKGNNYLEISPYIHEPSKYWKLDDTVLKTIETAPDPEWKEARDLILQIRRRDL